MSLVKLSTFSLSFVFLAIAGCSGESDVPPLHEVTVHVMIDGVPATNVQVNFVPTASGVGALGAAAGEAEIVMMTSGNDGVAAGSYEVAISEPVREMTPEALKSGSPPPLSFPAKYGSPKTSGFTATVEEKDGQEFVFLITSN